MGRGSCCGFLSKGMAWLDMYSLFCDPTVPWTLPAALDGASRAGSCLFHSLGGITVSMAAHGLWSSIPGLIPSLLPTTW